MLLPEDTADDEEGPGPSRWSERMPTSVGGLLVAAVVCVVVIGLCLAALAGAVAFLVRQ